MTRHPPSGCGPGTAADALPVRQLYPENHISLASETV